MRNLLLIIVLSAIIQTGFCSKCKVLLNELADTQSRFVMCTTRHAIPDQDNRFCGSCKIDNDNMTARYDLLMKDVNCSSLYKDADRMNIVITTQKLLQGLWDRAYCSNCFKDDGQVLNNFTLLSVEFQGCINTASNKNDLCQFCKKDYIYMNDFYIDLDKTNNGHICFDIQDIMNRTRGKWSKELKCCQREEKMGVFLTSVAVVAVLPLILFYSVAIGLTKRREAQHGLLNEQEPALDAPTTTQVITAAILSTPAPVMSEAPAVLLSRAEKPAQLLSLTDDSSDLSSDEEPAIKPKTN